MKSGYDSVAGTVSEWRAIVPETTPQVIGCYKNGSFANESVAREAFPHATIVTYDVNGSHPEASILDVEDHDAVPAQTPSWSRAYKGSLPHPGLYESASNVSVVVSTMLDAGHRRGDFLIHSAHYTFTAHICGPHTCGFPQADATQYADKGHRGENTDLNLFGDHFFGDAPKPDPDVNYRLFDSVKRSLIGGSTESGTVQEYDKWRAMQSRTSHPHRARLAVLRFRLRLLARRLNTVMRSEKNPTSQQRWRLRELQDRANGQRLV